MINTKQCFFCSQNSKDIDYKDTELLRRFMSPFSKIISQKKSGTCAKHQRQITQAIKRARYMSLLPYTPE